MASFNPNSPDSFMLDGNSDSFLVFTPTDPYNNVPDRNAKKRRIEQVYNNNEPPLPEIFSSDNGTLSSWLNISNLPVNTPMEMTEEDVLRLFDAG